MINIDDVEVMGIENAIKAIKAIKSIRNAMNNYDNSDSGFYQCNCPSVGTTWCSECGCRIGDCGKCYMSKYEIGEADMKLCKNLIKVGSSDSKFLRMVHVQADVIAPLYWWNEYDTYKVGTTANSCSTMHTIHKKELTIDDFSHEHLSERSISFLQNLIEEINRNRNLYVKGFKGVPGDNDCDVKPYDKAYWWQMIQLLPSSFNQMRTIDLDYETLYSIYHQRRNHQLDEWREFCKWIETLPYMKEFLELDEQTETKEENHEKG